MNPILVKYFNTSYEVYTTEYVVNKDDKTVYLCSKLAYKIACDLKKENELYMTNTRSLPIEWCKYQELYNTSYSNNIPEIIQKNYEKILEIVKNNFKFSVRIVEFIEEFYEYACNKDFVGTCRLALAISEKHLPQQIIQTLFNCIFEFYHEISEKLKFQLLLDIQISPFFINYNKKS